MSLTLDVIIVTRNRQEKLLRTVTFLLSGTSLPKRLIIVDSTENPKAIFRDAISKLCDRAGVELKFYRVVPRGISAARNFGIKRSHADIFSFLDDDELPTKLWAKIIIDRFSKDLSLKALTGPKYPLYPSNYYNQVWDSISGGIYPSKSGWTKFLSAGNSCYRREFIVRSKFLFDERMRGVASEDSVMSRNFYKAKIKIFFDRRLFVYHEFRTNLWGFAKQWFNYGKGTYEYHKFYTLGGDGEFSFQSIGSLWNAFLFSRSHIQPKSTRSILIPGLIIKELSFASGFIFSFIVERH